MRRVGTDETHVGEVPLGLFQRSEFRYKTYLRWVTQIILDGVDALGVTKEEPIHICTGYILSQARETLAEMGYDVVPVKVEGATQELAETEFVKSLVLLGVGGMEEVRSMRSFRGFLNWAMEGLGERERFVKTGWKSWPRLRRGG